jgi:hypothetical protein
MHAATIVTRMGGDAGTAAPVAARLERDRAKRGAAEPPFSSCVKIGSSQSVCQPRPAMAGHRSDTPFIDRRQAVLVPRYGFEER